MCKDIRILPSDFISTFRQFTFVLFLVSLFCLLLSRFLFVSCSENAHCVVIVVCVSGKGGGVFLVILLLLSASAISNHLVNIRSARTELYSFCGQVFALAYRTKKRDFRCGKAVK